MEGEQRQLRYLGARSKESQPDCQARAQDTNIARHFALGGGMYVINFILNYAAWNIFWPFASTVLLRPSVHIARYKLNY